MGKVGRRVRALSDIRSNQMRHMKRILRGSYDSAATNRNNERHWQYTDSFSADSANSRSVRKIIRERARYEVGSNSYAKGIVETLTNDLIGSGPRIKFLMENKERAESLGRRWLEWFTYNNIPEKLRTMKKAKTVDGETFGILTTNPNSELENKLDVRPIECDRITSPHIGINLEPNNIDGVILDNHGYVAKYFMLTTHPGDGGISFGTKFAEVLPMSMLHWFRSDRPEQHRGLSELTPALPLFAMLRRYTLAVVDSAESAANQSGVIKTSTSDSEDIDDLEPLDPVEMDRNVWTTLPLGWDISQIKAEQPTTTYPEFKKEILNEIARCLNMPRNIATADSSGYNYASGRLDHQTYDLSIDVERSDAEIELLNPITSAWWQEETLSTGRREDTPPHIYLWSDRPHVDPVKEANAGKTKLAAGLTNLAIEYAKDGRDWKAALLQRAEELKFCDENGIPVPEQSEESDANAEMIDAIVETIQEAMSHAAV